MPGTRRSACRTAGRPGRATPSSTASRCFATRPTRSSAPSSPGSRRPTCRRSCAGSSRACSAASRSSCGRPWSTASSRRAEHRDDRADRCGGARMMLIGLGGGTGAGKSAIVQSLVGRIGGCVIDVASYALDRGATPPDEQNPAEDEPAAVDTALLIEHLEGLRRGDAIRKPVYSTEARGRSGVEVIAPARLVLVEGLFTLWWEPL